MSNPVDANEAVHVVLGDSAAGTLRLALDLTKDRILVNRDQISCGPAPATNDLSHWRSIRESFLSSMYLDSPGFSFDDHADHSLLSHSLRLADAKQLVVWVAPSLGEQLLVAWLTVLSDQMQLDLSRILVVQFEHLDPNQTVRGVGELRPEDIQRIAPEPKRLSEVEITEYQEAWRAYTSSDPADLIRFLGRERSHRILSAAMKQLVYRYPSAKSGLSKSDEDLIHATDTKGPKASLIIGYAMAHGDCLDPLGDGYLFYRLRKLSDPSLACPLVSLSGDGKTMRHCEVRLTDFGLKVLAGKANALETNDIDDWIGGVHLDPSSSIPFRQGERLLIPT